MTIFRDFITIFVFSFSSIGVYSQNVINVAELIHASRTDEMESLFCDTRKQIPELTRWTRNNENDTIYVLESWSLSGGTFTLMYWSKDYLISVMQDNMSDKIVAHHRRAYTKRILALVEEWDKEKIQSNNASLKTTDSDYMYATRIILSTDAVDICTTELFDSFSEEDFDDCMELYKIWHSNE